MGKTGSFTTFGYHYHHCNFSRDHRGNHFAGQEAETGDYHLDFWRRSLGLGHADQFEDRWTVLFASLCGEHYARMDLLSLE
jgi:hypothetical protein